MNEKILHILNENMYIIIHIPKGIYHVVPFRIAQSCGVKESFHYLKIRLFDVGCRGGTKMQERVDFVLGVTKMAGLRLYMM
jgi:hypothetical protein